MSRGQGSGGTRGHGNGGIWDGGRWDLGGSAVGTWRHVLRPLLPLQVVPGDELEGLSQENNGE